MSNNIDERIVQMEFNNGQFERGIKESSKSLEEFQEKLKFKGATKGLKDLEKATGSFSLESMAQSIANIESRFTNMGLVGQRVLMRLTDRVYDWGKQAIKSLTVAPIKTGWDKYAELTSAVQTIMNSVDNVTMEDVQSQLAMLSWYTDETSYHFSDMVANIGKFTSAGQNLKTSVRAMIGIANACALAGANAGKADIAMYNFSQALAAGKVTLVDWKSIGSTAGLGTKEFKTTVIETAKALGKLNKEGKTARGTLVTFQNFEKTLNEGWYDSDVIIASLEKYGQFVERAYELVDQGKAKTAAEAIKMITDEEYALGKKAFRAAQEAKTFKEAVESAQEAVASGWMKSFQHIFGDYEEAKVLWTDLANALYDIFAESGNHRNDILAEWHVNEAHGYKKALESIYKILGSLWTIVEAVQEGFRQIFPESTVDQLYAITDKLGEMADYLDSIFWIEEKTIKTFFEKQQQFEEPITEAFDKAMRQGANGEGVKKLQERLISLGFDVGDTAADGIWGPKTEKAFKEFQEKYGLVVDGIYGEKSHTKLIEVLNGIGKSSVFAFDTEQVTEYSDKLDKIMRIARGFSSVLNIGKKILSGAWTVAGDIIKSLAPTANNILTFTAHIGDALTNLDKWIEDTQLVKTAIGLVEAWAKPYVDQINSVSSAILHFFGFGDEVDDSVSELTTFWDIWEKVKTSMAESGVLDRISESWEKLKATLTTLKETILGYWETVKTYLVDKFNGAIDTAGDWLPSIMETLGNGLSSALDFINGVLSKIPTGIDTIVNYFTTLYTSLAESDTVKAAGEKLSAAFGTIREAFESVIPKLKEYWTAVKNWLGEKLGSVFESIGKKMPDIIGTAGNVLSSIISWVGDFISNLPTKVEKVKSFFVNLYEKFKSSEKVQSIIEKAKTIFENVKNTLKNIWNTIHEFFFGKQSENADDTKKTPFLQFLTSSFETLKSIFETTVPKLKKYWTDAKAWLGNKFGSIFESIKAKWPDIKTTVGEGLSTAFNWILDTISKIPAHVTKVKAFFTDLYENLKSSEKVQSLITSLNGTWETVKTSLSNLWQSLINALFPKKNENRSNIKKTTLGERITAAFESISGFFERTIPKLKNWYEIARNWLSEKFGSIFESAKEKLPGVIESIGTGLGTAFSWLLNVIGNLPTHVQNIKTFFTDLIEKLKTSERVQKVVNKAKSIFRAVKDVLSEIWDTIISFLFPDQSVGSSGGSGGRSARRKRKKGGSGTYEGATEEVEEKVSYLQIIWDRIKSIASKVFDVIADAVSTIWNGFTKVWNALGWFKWVIAVAGVVLGLAALIGKLISPFSVLFGNIAILKRGYEKQKRGTALSNTLLELAAAIGIVAIAMYAIGKLKPEEFDRAAWTVGLIALAMTAIVGFFYSLSKIQGGKEAMTSAQKTIKSLLSLSIALAIVAAVVAALGYIPEEKLKQGSKWAGILYGSFLAISLLFMWLASKIRPTTMNIATKGLIGLGIAIGIMAGVAVLLGSVGWEKSLIGIGLLTIIMTLLGAFMYLMNRFGAKSVKLNIAIKGLIKMAIAIGILAGIVYLLGTMNGWQLLQGVVGLGAIALILGLLTKTVASAGSGLNTAALAVMFLGIAAVAIVITECIKAIKDVDYKVILSFIGGIAGVLLVIGGLSLLVGKLHAGGAVVGGAAAISVAFAVVAVVLTAVLGGLGAIDEAIANANTNGKGLKEYVQDGGAVLQAIADALDPFIGDWNGAAGMIGLAIASIVVGAIPGGGWLLMGGAASISASFTIIVTFLTALLAGLGAIDQCAKDAGVSGGEGLAGLIESGGDIFAAISGAVAKFVTGFVDTLVNSLTSNITKFGTAVNSLKESSAGLGTNEEIQADIDAAIGIFTYMGTYFKTLKPYDFTGSNFESYATAPRQLATDITTFSVSMAELRKATDGLAGDIEFDSNLATAVKAAGRIKMFFERLKPYEVHGSPFTGYFTAPGQLSTDIGLFGDALVSFRTGVEGLTDDMTTIPGTEPAINAAKSIQGFFVDIDEAFSTIKEKGTSLTEFNAEILSMLTDISLFGTRMGEVADKLNVESIVDGSITTQTDNAIEAAKSVAGFLIKLSFYGGSIEKNQSWLGRLFGKESTQQTVFSSVADLGSKTASAAKKLKGLETSDVEKIQAGVAVASSMVELVNSLSSNGSTIQGNTSVLADTIRLIGTLGTNLGTLHKNVKDMIVDPGTMANTEALSQLDIIDKMIAKVQTMSGISDAETAVNNLSTIISDIGLLGSSVLEADMYFTDDNVSHFTSIADGIGKIADAIFNVQVTTTSGVKSALATEIENISDALSSASWDGIDTNAIAASISAAIDMTIIQTIGTEFADAIGNGISLSELPYTSFGTILQSLASIGKDYKKNFENIGLQFNAGIERGIRSTSSRIYQAVREVVSQMVSVARNQADIHSPSGEGEDIGMYFNLGIVRGLLGYSDQVTAASRQVMENLIGSAVETAAAITAIINDDMDTQPVIRPVLDLSNVSIGAQSMNSMFGNRTIGVASTDMATRIRTNANYIPVGSRNNVNLSDSIQSVNDRLDNLGEAVTNMKIVLDSGVVAGQIAPKIDKHLGRAISLKGRG